MNNVLSRLLAILVFALPAVASAQEGLVISFPNGPSDYVAVPSPSAPSIQLPEASPPYVSFPSAGISIWLPSSGISVSEGAGDQVVVSVPSGPTVSTPPGGGVPVSLADDASIDLALPTGTSATVTFPSSPWRPTVTIPSTGIVFGAQGDGRMVVSFPGSKQPSIVLEWWENLSIWLPSGGDLTASLPSGTRPPIVLGPRAALMLKLPKYKTMTVWFRTRAWVAPWVSTAR